MSRIYKLKYENEDRPIYVKDVGHLLKLSGVMYQGMGASALFLMPTANYIEDLVIISPKLEDWQAILDASDDPVFFENNEHGNAKAIVRKQQRAISGAVQQKVWARDEFTCMYCGKEMGDVQLTVDHFVPLELGGENCMSNYISACRKCNKAKGCIEPEKYCDDNDLDYSGLVQYLSGNMPRYFIAHLQQP